MCFQDYWELDSFDKKELYLQFNIILSDVSAFLVDGSYSWGHKSFESSCSLFPLIDKCGISMKLQQVITGFFQLLIFYFFANRCFLFTFIIICISFMATILDPIRNISLSVHQDVNKNAIFVVLFLSRTLPPFNANSKDFFS